MLEWNLLTLTTRDCSIGLMLVSYGGLSMSSHHNIIKFSLIASMAGLLFGYDTAVIAGALTWLPQYFDLNATQTGWAVSSALVGCVLGAMISGNVGNKIGRKKTLLIAALCYSLSALGSAFAWSFSSFWMFRILGGFGIGLSAVVPLYISEISPKEKRGQLASLYQLSITAGILVVYFVNYLISKNASEEWGLTVAWRIMLGSELIPALLFTLLLLKLPESPRWLVMVDRSAEAKNVLGFLYGTSSSEIDHHISAIQHAINEEQQYQATSVFTPKVRPILMIACVIAILQQAVGINVIIYYGTKLMSDIGIGGENGAFIQSVLVGVVNFGATFIGIFLIDRWGRKPLMLIGTLGVSVTIFTVGISLLTNNTGAWLLPIILGYIVFFAATLGPIAWVWISELSPIAARAQVVSIAILCLWLSNIFVSQTFPMMNESTLNKEMFNGSLPFFIYGAFGIIFFLFVARFIPETKGRSLEEISHDIVTK